MAMQQTLAAEPCLTIQEGTVDRLLTSGPCVNGVVTGDGVAVNALAVVLTSGTFLKGLIHIGLNHFPAGRAGEACERTDCMRDLGFELGRLKTGTPPRLDRDSIDFSVMVPQPGDNPPTPFSHRTERISTPQLPCHLTYTNKQTHDIIRENLDRSPLYSGVIDSIGPRYCPSIEDKVVRFAERERHQIFIEPEGIDTKEFYPNGIQQAFRLTYRAKYFAPSQDSNTPKCSSLAMRLNMTIFLHGNSTQLLKQSTFPGFIMRDRSMELPGMKRRLLKESWRESTQY
jgi:tRNA uridine 5-carboxymethylaminomethyl modification enzyme